MKSILSFGSEYVFSSNTLVIKPVICLDLSYMIYVIEELEQLSH